MCIICQIDRYKPLQAELNNRFGEETKERIQIKQINIPDLTLPMALGRQDNFSLFLPYHRRMAAALIDVFMSE
jgi:tyrosinase